MLENFIFSLEIMVEGNVRNFYRNHSHYADCNGDNI